MRMRILYAEKRIGVPCKMTLVSKITFYLYHELHLYLYNYGVGDINNFYTHHTV